MSSMPTIPYRLSRGGKAGRLGGMAGTVTGGAQLLSRLRRTLCATCGANLSTMNAATAGSSATCSLVFDSENTDNIFVLMNGAYQLTFWAKAASGTPVLTASASRVQRGIQLWLIQAGADAELGAIYMELHGL